MSDGRRSKNGDDESDTSSNDDGVEFVGATFQPFIMGSESNEWNPHSESVFGLPPYKLIYNIEVFGRYCDECNNKLESPMTFAPDFITVDDKGGVLPLHTPGRGGHHHVVVKEELDNDEILKTRQVDRRIINTILCPNCSQRFIQGDLVEPVIHQFVTAAPILTHCQLTKKIRQPQLDHGKKKLATHARAFCQSRAMEFLC